MAESAALLVDEVFPEQPVRQWVLSVPYPLRFLFASRPAVMGRVLGIVYRCLATHLIKKGGFSRKTAQTGAITLIQRFGCSKSLPAFWSGLISRPARPVGVRCGSSHALRIRRSSRRSSPTWMRKHQSLKL